MADWVSPSARHRFAASVEGVVSPVGSVSELRDHYDAINTRRLDLALQNFAVDVEQTTLGGVPVAKVTPKAGVVDDGILLCLHGGAFIWGAGAGALIEAVPMAAMARRQVIAIDYRLAPEHLYPAAVDDALRCYDHLLEQRSSTSIGIYGCSAGGLLTAQTVARLIGEGRPRPAAIAMLHAAGLDIGGDSLAVAATLNGVAERDILPSLGSLPFLGEADSADPLVFPGHHPDIMADFPLTLLISGTRDFAASSVATMHRRLLAAGVAAEFVLFDGMWHAHHVDTDLPEAQETFAIMTRFFASHITG